MCRNVGVRAAESRKPYRRRRRRQRAFTARRRITGLRRSMAIMTIGDDDAQNKHICVRDRTADVCASYA